MFTKVLCQFIASTAQVSTEDGTNPLVEAANGLWEKDEESGEEAGYIIERPGLELVSEGEGGPNVPGSAERLLSMLGGRVG